MKSEKQVGKKAFDYHKAGFHCAEAVSKAVVETYSQGKCSDISKPLSCINKMAKSG